MRIHHNSRDQAHATTDGEEILSRTQSAGEADRKHGCGPEEPLFRRFAVAKEWRAKDSGVG